jgi:hypothetical protein
MHLFFRSEIVFFIGPKYFLRRSSLFSLSISLYYRMAFANRYTFDLVPNHLCLKLSWTFPLSVSIRLIMLVLMNEFRWNGRLKWVVVCIFASKLNVLFPGVLFGGLSQWFDRYDSVVGRLLVLHRLYKYYRYYSI